MLKRTTFISVEAAISSEVAVDELLMLKYTICSGWSSRTEPRHESEGRVVRFDD